MPGWGSAFMVVTCLPNWKRYWIGKWLILSKLLLTLNSHHVFQLLRNCQCQTMFPDFRSGWNSASQTTFSRFYSLCFVYNWFNRCPQKEEHWSSRCMQQKWAQSCSQPNLCPGLGRIQEAVPLPAHRLQSALAATQPYSALTWCCSWDSHLFSCFPLDATTYRRKNAEWWTIERTCSLPYDRGVTERALTLKAALASNPPSSAWPWTIYLTPPTCVSSTATWEKYLLTLKVNYFKGSTRWCMKGLTYSTNPIQVWSLHLHPEQAPRSAGSE